MSRRLLAAVAGFAVGYAIVDVPMVLLGRAQKAAARRRRAAEWAEIERGLLRDVYVAAQVKADGLAVELERAERATANVRGVLSELLGYFATPSGAGPSGRLVAHVPDYVVARSRKALEP